RGGPRANPGGTAHQNTRVFCRGAPAGPAKPLLSVPLAQRFKHRQTMAGAVRFTTDELVEIETLLVSAADRALALEQEIFDELVRAILQQHDSLTALATALAELDCEASLAEIAAEQGYTRPVPLDRVTFDIPSP